MSDISNDNSNVNHSVSPSGGHGKSNGVSGGLSPGELTQALGGAAGDPPSSLDPRLADPQLQSQVGALIQLDPSLTDLDPQHLTGFVSSVSAGAKIARDTGDMKPLINTMRLAPSYNSFMQAIQVVNPQIAIEDSVKGSMVAEGKEVVAPGGKDVNGQSKSVNVFMLAISALLDLSESYMNAAEADGNVATLLSYGMKAVADKLQDMPGSIYTNVYYNSAGQKCYASVYTWMPNPEVQYLQSVSTQLSQMQQSENQRVNTDLQYKTTIIQTDTSFLQTWAQLLMVPWNS